MSKILSIELEDGEEVIASIKQALAEHKIGYAAVAGAEGKMKSLVVAPDGNSPALVKKSGEFYFMAVGGTISFEKGGYYSQMRVAMRDASDGGRGPHVTGRLLEGVAQGNLKISLSLREIAKIIVG